MAILQNRMTANALISLVPQSRRTAGRIIDRTDLADDAVQEALITASNMTSEPENLEAWFHRTVVHRSLAVRRASLRRARNEQTAWDTLHRVVRSGDPGRDLENKELQRHIASALSKLPGEQREAFMLHELEGLDYRQIATRQRVPVGTVRSRLNRARSALRRHLAVYRSRCPECNPGS